MLTNFSYDQGDNKFVDIKDYINNQIVPNATNTTTTGSLSVTGSIQFNLITLPPSLGRAPLPTICKYKTND